VINFELPEPVSELYAQELRLTTIIGDNDNWDALQGRGWTYIETPGKLVTKDGLISNLLTDCQTRATKEAMGRCNETGAEIPDNIATAFGRVALARISGFKIWHSGGYSALSEMRTVVISNPEINADPIFTSRIPETERKLQIVGGLLRPDNSFNSLRKLVKDYLSGQLDRLDLISNATHIAEVSAQYRQDVESTYKIIRSGINKNTPETKWHTLRRISNISRHLS
jgi:hypothetical protein